jgi:hypothetical protein
MQLNLIKLYKQNFLLVLVVMGLFLSCFASSELIITGINLNPDGIDTGYEWVELYNPTNKTLDLSDYSIQRGNGNNEDDWTLIWEGTLNTKLAPYNYYLIAEDKVSFSADFITSLKIENGPDGIRVLKDDLILETIGWGDLVFTEYYQGTSLPKPDNGEFLIRNHYFEDSQLNYSQTNNNSYDFYLTNTYIPQSSAGSKKIIISFEVLEKYLLFQNINFTDDDLFTDGYQVSPLPNQAKEINFEISLNYSQGCNQIESLIFEFNSNDYPMTRIDNSESCIFSGSFFLDYSLAPTKYQINLTVNTTENMINSTIIEFDYLAMSSFSVDSFRLDFSNISMSKDNIIEGDLDYNTKSNPTIKNTGNTILDFGLYASEFNSNNSLIPFQSLNYCFGLDCNKEDFIAIDSGINVIDLNLGIGESTALSFLLAVPSNSSSGKYSGEVGLMVMGN